MADDTTSSFPSTRRDGPGREGPGRGSRPAGNRDTGGFRIRLSDNEMQAARALQEAFGLRSTVAVLGFSLRTLAQQLERGQLDELVSQHRAQAGSRPAGGRPSERHRERGDERSHERGGRGPRIDPFARPARPAPAPAGQPGTDQAEPDQAEPVAALPDEAPSDETATPTAVPGTGGPAVEVAAAAEAADGGDEGRQGDA